MIFAVIPAAGKSSRMGRPKLSLPLGDRSVLDHVIAAFQAIRLEAVLVVVGPQTAGLIPSAERNGALVHLLSHETVDMQATVQGGLRWLEERYHPLPDHAWFLAPADHPLLEATVVQELLHAREARADKSIWIPTFKGKRGHPVLIRWNHVTGILALLPGQGINSYLREQHASILEIPVRTESVLLDLDLPEDYERLKRQFPKASEE